MKRGFVAAVVIGIARLAAGQAWDGGPSYYPERLQRDAEAIREAILSTHPDPYRFCPPEEFALAFASLRDSLNVPLRTSEFVARLLPVMQRLGDAHLLPMLDAPTEERLLRKAPVLPLKVRLLDGELYVEEELKGFLSLVPGSRILSVDGIPAERIIEETGRLVVTDGANQTYRWRSIEQGFPWLFLRAFGYRPGFHVEAETPAGSRVAAYVMALSGEEIERSRKPQGMRLHPWTSTWYPESSALWVRFSTLDHAVLEGSGQKPARFIKAALQQLESDHAKALVLDVRGADGPELAVAEEIFAMVALAPYRVVKQLGTAHAEAATMEDERPVREDRRASGYGRAEAAKAGALHDPRLACINPDAKAYKGKVYVVCDGGTRGAAAALVMLAKRQRRARIIGEETGSNAARFTGGLEVLFIAPESGIRLRIPTMLYVPDGDLEGPADHGEQPHHQVQQQPWGIVKGRDTVQGALLEMIREL
jgi:hypothetical protein